MKKQVAEKTQEFEDLLKTSAEQMWWTDLEALDQVFAETELARETAAAKTAKHVQDSRARADREKGKQVKKGRKKKGPEATGEDLDLDEAEEDEEVVQETGKSKGKGKAGAEGRRRPVLMPLDLRTQKTLQAVARECAMEAQAEEAEAPVVLQEEEPAGLLARLLKARGEDGFSSSQDFFAISSSSPTPEVETPAAETNAADAPAAKGAKRGQAAADDGDKPAAKKPRKKAA